MKRCKSVYSKGRMRRAWNKGEKLNFSNKRREHLSEKDKGSYYNQSEWLEEYGNSGLYYSRTFDEIYLVK